MKTTSLIGKEVVNSTGKSLGIVDNLVIDENTDLVTGINIKETKDDGSSKDLTLFLYEINKVGNNVIVKI
ncbi:PRC-barrel domain protein [Methanobrevibacter cuticularis]|uniref:PRC-barrel domain protein n=1 Tax=Methanobrevibacter cuticularis TaxID=47311 RepID=A0A166D3T6_9EURY|nr:PRC-barrel domain-containing protein [Methanobrevibacter cuticularis]KZX15171.1 PRC-barrel domain protein [Methanobrevibacter cuticularis]